MPALACIPVPAVETALEAAKRLRLAGPGALDDLEALEVLAGVTPAQAAALISEFGSLPEVCAADRAALCRKVPRPAADRLALAADLARRLLAAPLAQRCVLSNWSAVVGYLRLAIGARPREQFRVLYLDKRNRLIRDEVVGEGTVDHAPVYPREVVRRALELNASALVLAHNHPAADPTPSTADIDMTRQVVEAARALRIAVHDHIIVAGEGVASFKTLGLM